MPRNKLTPGEEKRLLAVLTSPEFRDLSPRQVIPALAERGEYIASEATAYRLLRAYKLQHHRENTRPRRHKKPDELVADAPNQVYCWDITYLKSPISGMFYYLYLVTDIFSRRIVAECASVAWTRRNLLARSTSRFNVSSRSSARSSSGAVEMRACSWFAACLRACIANRRSTRRIRIASTGPFWAFGAPIASPASVARAAATASASSDFPCRRRACLFGRFTSTTDTDAARRWLTNPDPYEPVPSTPMHPRAPKPVSQASSFA
ncbi:MAG: hypothetical protein R3B07_15280 [Polyangiaceae bacterium]